MNTFTAHAGWTIAALASLTLALTWGGVVNGGPLDPPGSPAPTMKTLDDMPPSWHRNLIATGGCDSPRFDCVLTADDAVLDRATGLVWDRSPSFAATSWSIALSTCAGAGTGGVSGWRLPTHSELMTLVEGGASNPALPSGHPFSSVDNVAYWTVTFNGATTNNTLRTVHFGTGSGTGLLVEGGMSTAELWCVRGPGGYDGLR